MLNLYRVCYTAKAFAYSCTLSTSGFFKMVGSSLRNVPDREPTVGSFSSDDSPLMFGVQTSLLFCLFLPLMEPLETTLRVALLLTLLAFAIPLPVVLLLSVSLPQDLPTPLPDSLLLFTGLATGWLRVWSLAGVRLFAEMLVDGPETDLTTFSGLTVVGILLFTNAALPFVGDLAASNRLLLSEGDPVYAEDVRPERTLKVGESRGETIVCRITIRLAVAAGDLGWLISFFVSPVFAAFTKLPLLPSRRELVDCDPFEVGDLGVVTIFSNSFFLVEVSPENVCSAAARKSVDTVTSTPILPKHFLPLSFMGGVSGLVDPTLRLGALALASIFAVSFSPLAADSAKESVDITSSLNFCLTKGVSGRVEMQLRLVALSLVSFTTRLPPPFDCTSLRESVDMAVISLSFLFLLLISFPGGVSDLLTKFLLEELPMVAAFPLPDPSPLDVERLIAGDDVRDESDDDIIVFPALRGINPDFSGVPILEELELALCFTDLDLF